MFLTLFGEKMTGTDPEHEILAAFECFDHKKTGLINAEVLREAMIGMGDRFTDDEVLLANLGGYYDERNDLGS
jgi:Ca2+-binding EF-hand superfamily protein